MIIVSQNKDKIVNFDNIITICIDEPFENIDNEFEIVIETDGMTVRSGRYATEERAKEVLQEIIKVYRNYRIAKCDVYMNVLEESAVFEMPEE